MANAVYPLLLLLVLYVLGMAFFKSDLFGYVLVCGFEIALMIVIRHYSELYVWGLAIQEHSPLGALLASANSAITVAVASLPPSCLASPGCSSDAVFKPLRLLCQRRRRRRLRAVDRL